MSRGRTSSEVIKSPHSVSLKVLRLSRPSPSQQTPLPPSSPGSPFHINPLAALSSHSTVLGDSSFILSPILTLPSSFGILHAGETFTCTLCVNNELFPTNSSSPTSNEAPRNIPTIKAVRIMAEIQTPSSVTPIQLDLTAEPTTEDPAANVHLSPGETLQRILRYHLREEGNHVLAITVTYTETQTAAATQVGAPRHSTSGRVRTFRKLYQFGAQSLMGIRTKIRALPTPTTMQGSKHISATSGKTQSASYILEAQLENYSDTTVLLDDVEVLPRDGLSSHSLNAWDKSDQIKPLIAPGDIMQVGFMLREKGDAMAVGAEEKMRNEALGLCQLNVRWRGNMGEEGELMTAWLGGKRR